MLKNGQHLFDSQIGQQGTPPYSGQITVSQGDVVDFAIGVGPDGTDSFDRAILTAIISKACQFDANSVSPPDLSLNNMQSIKLTFAPSIGGTQMSLADAADACHFNGFDWQQTIDILPCPSPFFANARDVDSKNICSNGGSLNSGNLFGSPNAPPFSDPPNEGYTAPPKYVGLNPFPFYYYFSDANTPGVHCSYFDPDNKNCDSAPYSYTVSKDDKTLSFYDPPSDPCLPGDGTANEPTKLNRIIVGCDPDKGIPNSFIAFTTTLVGIMKDGSVSPLGFEWKWKTTFNGTSGQIYTLDNNLPPDPGSGTGGITVTSINGVPQTPPSVSCTASPNTLWPPNGQPVSVTVSGIITPGTSPLAPNGTNYLVIDEYGQDQPNGNFTLGSGGSYLFQVSLIASRKGNDKDGRTYTIIVNGQDTLGNVGSCSSVVTVPHDQGQ